MRGLGYALGFLFMNFLLGMFIGGNFGFPSVAGLEAGYESAGVYFAFMGLGWGVVVGFASAYESFQKKFTPFILTILALEAFQVLMLFWSMGKG